MDRSIHDLSAKSYSIECKRVRPVPTASTVHDVSGRLVRRLEAGPRLAGRHAARWDGTDSRGHALPAGVYFVRLNVGGVSSSRRVSLIR